MVEPNLTLKKDHPLEATLPQLESSTTPNSRIVVEGRGIGRVFGQGELAFRALHPTNIEVRRNEVLALMGPSGSGKTTLLSILGCVLRPTEGEVWLMGSPLGHLDEEALTRLRRDKVGFVFQQFNLLSGLTALENVTVPLVLLRVADEEREVRGRAMLARVGLQGKEQARPKQLSGGQQQRVAIARALVTEAPVLLCDEPTAALDGTTGRSVLTLVQNLARELNRAVVIVTHDERVLPFADRLVHVEDGRIEERNLENRERRRESHHE